MIQLYVQSKTKTYQSCFLKNWKFGGKDKDIEKYKFQDKITNLAEKYLAFFKNFVKIVLVYYVIILL